MKQISTSDPVLEFAKVRVRRGGREVLHISELSVDEGAVLAILGPNGSGKSTLLLTAALLLPISEGTVSLFGEPAVGRSEVRLRRQTSTVFQDPALLDMDVRRNIEIALAFRNVSSRARREQSERWLNRLGIKHLEKAMPHALSGGEARRVSLARAFAIHPRLLFLDEPFSALDPEARSEMIGDLRQLLRDEGTTAMLVTHDHSEAQLLADQVLVLFDGVQGQLDSTRALFNFPANPEVASFLGYSIVDPKGLPELLRIVVPRISAIHPAAVRLTDDTEGSYSAQVIAVQGSHGDGRLLLAVGEEKITATMPVDRINELDLRPGIAIRFEVDTGGIIDWSGSG